MEIFDIFLTSWKLPNQILLGCTIPTELQTCNKSEGRESQTQTKKKRNPMSCPGGFSTCWRTLGFWQFKHLFHATLWWETYEKGKLDLSGLHLLGKHWALQNSPQKEDLNQLSRYQFLQDLGGGKNTPMLDMGYLGTSFLPQLHSQETHSKSRWAREGANLQLAPQDLKEHVEPRTGCSALAVIAHKLPG